jgi:SAM-dependent methyltransferase
VVGIDFDALAISSAKKNFPKTNIDFILGDIRKDIPEGPFRNVVWDAGIEHFTEDEIEKLMSRIKTVLTPGGILSGYTIQENHDQDSKLLHQHEYEFHSKEDLARFFSPFFVNVQVIETKYPERTNYYFYASDGELPFEKSNILTMSSKSQT